MGLSERERERDLRELLKRVNDGVDFGDDDRKPFEQYGSYDLI